MPFDHLRRTRRRPHAGTLCRMDPDHQNVADTMRDARTEYWDRLLRREDSHRPPVAVAVRHLRRGRARPTAPDHRARLRGWARRDLLRELRPRRDRRGRLPHGDRRLSLAGRPARGACVVPRCTHRGPGPRRTGPRRRRPSSRLRAVLPACDHRGRGGDAARPGGGHRESRRPARRRVPDGARLERRQGDRRRTSDGSSCRRRSRLAPSRAASTSRTRSRGSASPSTARTTRTSQGPCSDATPTERSRPDR